MVHISVSFDLGQRVSSTLSILLILLLSVLVALLTLRAARDIVSMAETSPVFHIENRSNGNSDQDMMSSQSPVPAGCSRDAKVCPDGSVVGRVAPLCNFAPCPNEKFGE
ncbi:MAG: hypothetical protein IPK84_01030 [Candidatus Moraniibacteriota bacterium]|nr:MAG: hypothetical protein IPK84_01030 [Candidatus Moranbacteria bacterium]